MDETVGFRRLPVSFILNCGVGNLQFTRDDLPFISKSLKTRDFFILTLNLFVYSPIFEKETSKFTLPFDEVTSPSLLSWINHAWAWLWPN